MALVSHLAPDTSAFAGIRWQSDAAGMGRAEARTRAKAAGANAYLLRANNENLATAQLSGRTAIWRGKRLVSLASALADTAQADSWCGVFEFEGRFVYVATNNRAVLADTDVIFNSAADARSRLDAERDLFTTVYAPASWEVDGAISSSELLDSIQWTTVAPLQLMAGGSARSPRLMLMVGAGAVLAAIGGYQYWRSVELQREAAEAAARQTPPPPPNPWIMKPKPERAARACLEARSIVADMAHQGWKLDKLECDIEGGKYSATLLSYTVSSLLPTAKPGVSIKLAADGRGIEVAGPIAPPPGPSRLAEHGSIGSALAARNEIVSIAQAVAWQASDSRNQFSFQVAANLEQLASQLGALPTLSLTRITFSGGQWRVDGEIFN